MVRSSTRTLHLVRVLLIMVMIGGTLSNAQIDCGMLTQPSNSFMTISWTTFGNSANFSCNIGYKLIGSVTRLCESNGQWSGSMPNCEMIDCGLLTKPSYSTVTISGTSYGDTANFSCDVGFHLIGNKTLLCESDGEWSSSLPKCLIIDCGMLTKPSNSIMTISGTTFGNSANFSCNIGYNLIGSETRLCESNGQWSASMPDCLIIDCGMLTKPSNSIMTIYGTTYGNSANFSCNIGYKLIGSETRLCESNGQWSDSMPNCLIIDCGMLIKPNNSIMTISETTFGNSANFSCDVGYKLIGSGTRLCESNGQWSDSMPDCLIIDCGMLIKPNNSIMTISETTFGNSANFSCDIGYKLIGSETLLCESNGQWSASMPDCLIIECGMLTKPSNSIMTISETTYGNSANFSCNIGYNLIGSESRLCESNGQWSDSMPICRIVDCGMLIKPNNSIMTISGTTFGNSANFSCDIGYKLIGSGTRLCESNGQWSDSMPDCLIIDCGMLIKPNNSIMTISETTFGNSANFSCNIGYNLIGSETLLCESNGQWSASMPDCLIIDCGMLTKPNNSIMTISGTTFGNSANFSCNIGYNLIGSETRLCESNGQWSDSMPKCQIVDCGMLTKPNNSIMTISGTTFGNSANFSCDIGYKLIGSETRLCESNGQWSASMPNCESFVDCGMLTKPSNSFMTISGTTFGNSANFSCNIGYKLIGSETRLCESNGQWSDSMPKCDIIDCGMLTKPNNSIMTIFGTTFGNFVNFSCTIGYKLIGSETRLCESNGQWSDSMPKCDIIDCGMLTKPNNSIMTIFGTTFGNFVNFSCTIGYKLIGSETRLCESNGQWSDSMPKCDIIECETSAAFIDNGRIERLQGTLVGNTMIYKCTEGYTLVGSNTTTCQHDGTWSPPKPLCVSKGRCEVLATVEHGVVNVVGGTSFGAKAFYQCYTGYVLNGVALRICQRDWTWSHTDPTCTLKDCGSIGVILNGHTNMSRTTYGGTIQYICDPGYRLVGKQLLTCTIDGWNFPKPSCVSSGCERLDAPENGFVDLPNRADYGQTATYRCKAGYKLIGSLARRCTQLGEWTGNKPVCNLDCGELSPPVFGKVNISEGTLLGCIAQYTCSVGFILDGTATRECKEDGLWSGSKPSCRIADCGPLMAPNNGEVLVSRGTLYGEEAIYKCNSKYSLTGSASRYCSENGTWNGTQPTCNFSGVQLSLGLGVGCAGAVILIIVLVLLSMVWYKHRGRKITRRKMDGQREFLTGSFFPLKLNSGSSINPDVGKASELMKDVSPNVPKQLINQRQTDK